MFHHSNLNLNICGNGKLFIFRRRCFCSIGQQFRYAIRTISKYALYIILNNLKGYERGICVMVFKQSQFY